ncbi:MAG: Cys-tRNA(Pro) deacylase [Candidatus Onthomonas sp.]|nr:Cys-tRNA(Pro) deacylase [Candidatus Onthomonas sp.]
MKNKMEKTNVMRILDQKKIPYEIRTYPHGDEAVDGIEVARLLEQDPKTVYKTLVAQGASRQYYVFDIPVDAELDLKKAAKAVGEKSVAMLHVKDLLPLTGYVRGGCSPIGMKKQFFTTFQVQAEELNRVAVSAGKIGYQVILDPKEIVKLVRGQFGDVIK